MRSGFLSLSDRIEALLEFAATRAPSAYIKVDATATWVAARFKPLRRIDPVIVALTVLAFGVASYRLGAKSLWLDESISANYASRGLTDLWAALTGNSPPYQTLYIVLLNFWTRLFGSSEIALRSLTVLLGGLAVPVMVLLGTRLFGRPAGLVSGLLLAVSPFFVHYEQTARTYALVVLLVTLSSYFFVRELEQPSRATRVGFVLASALAINAHYMAAFVLLVQFLTLLAVKRRAALTREWLLAAGAIAILCVPAAVTAHRQGTSGLDWIPTPSFSSLIDVPSEIAGGKVLLITLVILACYGLFRAIDDHRLWRAGFVAAWFLVPVLLVFAVSKLGRPAFLSNYLIVVLPALLLLAAAGLVRLPGRAIGVGVLGVLVAASAVGISDWYRRPSFEDYRGATRYILGHQRAGDQIIYDPSYIDQGFAYYQARAGRSGPSEGVPGTRPPRMWLVERFGDPSPQIEQSIAGAYAPVTSQSFPSPVVTLYRARSTPSTTPSSSNAFGEVPSASALSHANLQPSGLPQGWKTVVPPQDSLAKHLFVCLNLLGSEQRSTAISATGPGQLKMISEAVGWPTSTGAQRATAALARGSGDAKSCVASSPHFVTTDFSSSGSVRASKSPSQARAHTAAAKQTVVYGLSYRGPNGAARGALVVTTRGRATAVILAYRMGKQPFPAKLLPGLVASAYQRLGQATPGGP
jgi:mannosyltransferase